MALIEIKGKISRIFYNNKGLEVTESYETKTGETKEKRYTVWLNSPTVLETGTDVTVKGLHSAEIDEWTDKEGKTRHSVKVSLNNPLVIPGETSGVSQTTHEELPF